VPEIRYEQKRESGRYHVSARQQKKYTNNTSSLASREEGKKRAFEKPAVLCRTHHVVAAPNDNMKTRGCRIWLDCGSEYDPSKLYSTTSSRYSIFNIFDDDSFDFFVS